MSKTRFIGSFVILLAGLSMGYHFRYAVRGNTIALIDLTLYERRSVPAALQNDSSIVGHAGGAIHGITYTNSLEALNENYSSGIRLFELDFLWTSDGQLVLAHDWNSISDEFGIPRQKLDYKTFISCIRRDGLHQLTFEQLVQWMHDHPDAYVVTDTKDNNIRLLNYLRSNADDLLPHMILQIYRLNELQAARNLHPHAVWLTIYKCGYPAWALARIHSVDGFVIPLEVYPHYRQLGIGNRIHLYVHSVDAHDLNTVRKRYPEIYGYFVN